MRVHIYKGVEGRHQVFVEPSPGKGRPPVLLRGITSGNVVSAVLPAVEAMRKPKAPRKTAEGPE